MKKLFAQANGRDTGALMTEWERSHNSLLEEYRLLMSQQVDDIEQSMEAVAGDLRTEKAKSKGLEKELTQARDVAQAQKAKMESLLQSLCTRIQATTGKELVKGNELGLAVCDAMLFPPGGLSRSYDAETPSPHSSGVSCQRSPDSAGLGPGMTIGAEGVRRRILPTAAHHNNGSPPPPPDGASGRMNT